MERCASGAGETRPHSAAVGTQWDAPLKELLTFERLAKYGVGVCCGSDSLTAVMMRQDKAGLRPIKWS